MGNMKLVFGILLVCLVAASSVQSASVKPISQSELKNALSDWLASIGGQITGGVTDIANNAIQNLFLQITEALINVSNGKRDVVQDQLKNVWADFLQNMIGSVGSQVIAPAAQGAIQTVAGMLAQATASVAIDGIPALQALLAGLGK